MTRLSGYVFDTYDDVDGRVLRSMKTSVEELQPFVKTATRLSEDQINTLPDDRFALVLLDGGRKLKKYATVDKGNTALSVMYLMKQANILPPEAIKIAARNLMAACQNHGLTVPSGLRKMAKLERLAKKADKTAIDGTSLGSHDAGVEDIDHRTNYNGTPGSNFMELPEFSQKEHKLAGVHEDILRHESPEGQEVRVRERAWRESPYIDMSSWDPSKYTETKQDGPNPWQNYLGDNKYPVDGYDQVKTASAYFDDNWKQFHPRDRHYYCVKLASRMSELGMSVPKDIERYGSEKYACDVEAMVSYRRKFLHEEFQPMVDLLLEKRSQVSPFAFAEALSELDEQTGLKYQWDGDIPDPWYSTFGPSKEKVAGADWRYEDNGVHICEGDLNNLATNGTELVSKAFGESMANEFRKKPKAVFDSLPKPNKLILARMAMDRNSGTGTE
jgi:hypothetical protein